MICKPEEDHVITPETVVVYENGRRLVVRKGSLPEREILTGVGPVAVSQPGARDKRQGKRWTPLPVSVIREAPETRDQINYFALRSAHGQVVAHVS